MRQLPWIRIEYLGRKLLDKLRKMSLCPWQSNHHIWSIIFLFRACTDPALMEEAARPGPIQAVEQEAVPRMEGIQWRMSQWHHQKIFKRKIRIEIHFKNCSLQSKTGSTKEIKRLDSFKKSLKKNGVLMQVFHRPRRPLLNKLPRSSTIKSFTCFPSSIRRVSSSRWKVTEY